MNDVLKFLIQRDMLIVMIVLTIMVLSMFYRIFRGPHAVDRVSALNSIYIIIAVLMVLYGCYADRSIYIDLGLCLLILGFIEIVIICKHLEGKR